MTLEVLLATSAKEELLDHTFGMVRDLNVNLTVTMEVGLKLLMSKICNLTQVI